MNLTYRHTKVTCYISYITGALVVTYMPLLFFYFRQQYGLSLSQLAFLVTANFITQICVDFFGARYADRIGYRKLVVTAELLATAGLVSLGILPDLLPHPYTGLLLSTVCCAMGGGLLETLISPMIEALPDDAKASNMGFLHSCYSWGYVGVVLLSTLFFTVFGIENWRILTWIWALAPLATAVLFSLVPIRVYGSETQVLSFGKLLQTKQFWLFFLLMLCAGAAEQAVSQWISYFAEGTLHLAKTLGDLLGPCAFAALLGVSRVVYASFGTKIDLKSYLAASSLLCAVGLIGASLSPNPILSLLGYGICGFAVGAMWPGVLSLSALHCPQGGTAMFGLLAMGGDVGCFSGPETVALLTGAFSGAGLKAGMLGASVFPILMVLCLLSLRRMHTPTA